ncbi:hypothetical protein TNCT_695201 [Trichonephila clavata]|uniref:Uncharacterized protein n=1 Tax=Trichonephila clavata TaxID=2740835 RepID=A0A8X6IIE5_TRICU|nr:hypothetical protein TNCT_695201 [Trichonephila clavata]
MLTDCKIHRPAVLFSSTTFFLSPAFSLPLPSFYPVRPGLVLSSLSIYMLHPLPDSPIHGLACCQVLQCMLNPLPGVGIRSLHAPPKSKISPLWLTLPFRTKEQH